MGRIGIAFSCLVLLPVASGALSRGQAAAPLSTPTVTLTLTLAQAEAIAIANQPRILAAQLRARASEQRIREARSGLFPTVAFNATGVRVADTGTRMAVVSSKW
jgi:outer membrane protein